MKNISLRFVYDKNKRATESKPQPLTVEVRQNGTNKAVYINTGFKLYPNQFSERNGFTCKNHSRAPYVTKEARRIFEKIEDFAYSDKCKVLEDVKNYNKEKAYDANVVNFMKRELIESNPTPAVLDHHRSLISRIEEFGEIETFDDLSYESIDRFDKHLRKTINSQQVLYKRHKVFSKYIDKAIKLGLCKENPYDDYKVPRGVALKKPTFLTEQELQKIKDYQPVDEKLQRVKDLFVFQCYTGLAYVDLQSFDEDWITEVDGYKIISSNRQKTDQPYITILFPEAEAILEKYDYKLPVISNQKYNDYLKLLKAGAEIKKNITSHVGRHTFATLLINKDVPIESVSKALGHSNIKQTEEYAHLLGKKVVSDMAKLIDLSK